MSEFQRVIIPQENLFSQMGIRNVYVDKIIFYEKNKRMDLVCDVVSPKFLNEVELIYDKVRKKWQDLEIDFKIRYREGNFTPGDIKDIVERAIKRLKNKNATSRTFLYFYRISTEQSGEKFTVHLQLNNELAIKTLKEMRIQSKLEEIIRNFGVPEIEVCLDLGDFSKEVSEIVDLSDAKLKELEEEAEKSNIVNIGDMPKKKEKSVSFGAAPAQGKSAPFWKTNDGGKGKRLQAEIKGSVIPIDEYYALDPGDEGIVVQGKVFHYETRETRTGRMIATIGITDEKNSMMAKFWLSPNLDTDFAAMKYVKLSGTKKINDNSPDKEPEFWASSINPLTLGEEKKTDTAPEKMVELHTHTKMSEMVGVCDAGELIQRAAEYGHKAIAITDYAVVHAFPRAYKAAKEKGKDFKLILGCEISLVNDGENIIRNPKDIDFEEETFVVFDLETCGLNEHENPIIEIGAVKLKGTRIVDRFSRFVNPGRPIPPKIQELTGITDQMVANEPAIDEVLPAFLEFAGDATMVAHNAPFDMGFITRDAKKILGIDFRPSVMDTLTLAKAIYPGLKSYGLGPLNKLLGLSLENHHRAVDDAQATSLMFTIFLEKYREKGVKNLLDFDGAFPKNIKNAECYNCVLLVKNKTGLRNLYELISLAHTDYYGNRKPKIPKTLLQEKREGLLVGSALTAHNLNYGELTAHYLHYDFEKAAESVSFYDYIEFLPMGAYAELVDDSGSGVMKDLTDVMDMDRWFYRLAREHEIPVTASSDVHYLNESDAILRSVLVYGGGTAYKPESYMTDNKFWFRTTDELLAEFSWLGEETAREIVVANTNRIAGLIEDVRPIPEDFFPPKIENAEKIIKEMTYEKAHRIYGDPLPEVVSERLKKELDAIINNDFAVLYLSAQKLVKKSLDNGYLVGSRGSVGSSLVAYMMGITEVNALYPHYICDNPDCKYSEFTDKAGCGVDMPEKICPKCGKPLRRDGFTIPFEVFMGFDGEKTPDIDLNFSGEYQSEIHRYCETLFGRENVFKAGTISTLAAKNAYGYIKKYYEENNIPIERAHIERLAKLIEGAKKTTGQHPGGMIVLPNDVSIYEFCPVQKPANDQTSDSVTTHFDYHEMEDQLVKLDILGHDDPTTIKLLQEYTGVDVYEIPLTDPETLKIFRGTEPLGVKGDDIGSDIGTYGIPEFGTDFVIKILKDTKPRTFTELVRIAGLSHGTDVWLNNAQELVKNGTATLSEIITVRDDIMNYLIDCGISKQQAFDIMEFVRKGKPSKDPAKWEKHSAEMRAKNVPDWYIESCRKIKYMFPKGHAVAYVMMAMRIAYFKVHYPLAFYAAYFSRKAEDFNYELMRDVGAVKEQIKALRRESNLDAKKKATLTVCEVIVEMNARGFSFLPIDLFKSDAKKFVPEEGKIRFPLIALNGLGESAATKIVEERCKEEFLSYEDLRKRTQLSGTILDKLRKLGCIGNLSESNQKSLF
ncbi:MAG: PolC-type DNA polymerase III [Fusobacteriaceae bacterium]|jgi:DNA polymerase-3 subunit alpha (Gram-positive type)|nr:PolC-type DNA polymerase III [Fusobacteriaceae bacterium]